MTDLQTWKPGSNPHPATHPSERAFEDFLTANGYDYTKEQDRFDLEDEVVGKTAKAVTPDYRIISSPDGLRYGNLFIEICEADRFVRGTELPEAVRTKNLRQSDSGKAYISPRNYLRRKRERMQKAEGRHGVVILVLTYAQQQAVISDPSLLLRLIDRRIDALSPLRRTS